MSTQQLSNALDRSPRTRSLPRRSGSPIGRPLGFDVQKHVEQFSRRVLQDALAEALPAYWLRRAEVFDQVGTAAADEIALACRRHAELLAERWSA